MACTKAEIELLGIMQEKLCLNFAMKDVKKDTSLFSKVESTMDTRRPNLAVKPIGNTTRFQKSSIPYFSQLLNQNKK